MLSYGTTATTISVNYVVARPECIPNGAMTYGLPTVGFRALARGENISFSNFAEALLEADLKPHQYR
jgi:hypothetical protein